MQRNLISALENSYAQIPPNCETTFIQTGHEVRICFQGTECWKRIKLLRLPSSTKILINNWTRRRRVLSNTCGLDSPFFYFEMTHPATSKCTLSHRDRYADAFPANHIQSTTIRHTKWRQELNSNGIHTPKRSTKWPLQKLDKRLQFRLNCPNRPLRIYCARVAVSTERSCCALLARPDPNQKYVKVKWSNRGCKLEAMLHYTNKTLDNAGKY